MRDVLQKLTHSPLTRIQRPTRPTTRASDVPEVQLQCRPLAQLRLLFEMQVQCHPVAELVSARCPKFSKASLQKNKTELLLVLSRHLIPPSAREAKTSAALIW